MRDGKLLKPQHFYDFAGFRLDISEKTLLQEGKPVPLTPKVFDTLCCFVKNSGHLLEKEELINEIWQNQFVEDSNLTYNIKMLRKALGDNAGAPVFIETVPRRGYRFIAEVEEVTIAAQLPIEQEILIEPVQKNDFVPIALSATVQSASDPHSAPVNQNKRNFIPIVSFVGVILAAIIFAGLWHAKTGIVRADSSVLSAPFSSENLSTNGQVDHAIISPDGKNLFYTNAFGGKQSLWVRQLESANNSQIIPPSDENLFGIALSPDDQHLYFTRGLPGSDKQLSIYRSSVFGGVPDRIADNTQGWISLSPNGEKISFVRCYYRDDDYCSLWEADAADGKNERKLVSRPRPFRIADNKFSPDGETIAFAVGQSETNANDFGLATVNTETGAEREIKTQKFFDIKSLVWLPDQKNLLLAARQNTDRNFGIWQISTDSGEARPLTKDSENYSTLSVDKLATKIISTQIKRDYRLMLYEMGKISEKRNLADAVTVSFANNEKMFFSSEMTGGAAQIWSINSDGSQQRQLTNGKDDSRYSISSPDNNFVFFASNRSGDDQVWRMNSDGSNQVQITQKEGGFPIIVSPDSKWVYYRSALSKNLWRVSTQGGEETLILDKRKNDFSVSADCSKVAFFDNQKEEKSISIVSLTDQRVLKNFKLVNNQSISELLLWSFDGETIFYILGDRLEKNSLWQQPIAGGQPQQIIDFDDDQVTSLSLSPDGTKLAVVQGNWRKDAVLLKGVK